MMEYSDPRDFGFRPETVMTALMPYEQFSSKTRRLILGIDMGIVSLAVYVQFPLLALDFRHGVQNESSSQRKGGNKHERHG